MSSCRELACGELPTWVVATSALTGIALMVLSLFSYRILCRVRFRLSYISLLTSEVPFDCNEAVRGNFNGRYCLTTTLTQILVWFPVFGVVAWSIFTAYLVWDYYDGSRWPVTIGASLCLMGLAIVAAIYAFLHWRANRFRMSCSVAFCFALSYVFVLAVCSLYLPEMETHASFYLVYCAHSLGCFIWACYVYAEERPSLSFSSMLKEPKKMRTTRGKGGVIALIALGYVVGFVLFGVMYRHWDITEEHKLGWIYAALTAFVDMGVYIHYLCGLESSPLYLYGAAAVGRLILLRFNRTYFFFAMTLIYVVLALSLIYQFMARHIPVRDKASLMDLIYRDLKAKEDGRKRSIKGWCSPNGWCGKLLSGAWGPVLGTLVLSIPYGVVLLVAALERDNETYFPRYVTVSNKHAQYLFGVAGLLVVVMVSLMIGLTKNLDYYGTYRIVAGQTSAPCCCGLFSRCCGRRSYNRCLKRGMSIPVTPYVLALVVWGASYLSFFLMHRITGSTILDVCSHFIGPIVVLTLFLYHSWRANGYFWNRYYKQGLYSPLADPWRFVKQIVFRYCCCDAFRRLCGSCDRFGGQQCVSAFVCCGRPCCCRTRECCAYGPLETPPATAGGGADLPPNGVANAVEAPSDQKMQAALPAAGQTTDGAQGGGDAATENGHSVEDYEIVVFAGALSGVIFWFQQHLLALGVSTNASLSLSFAVATAILVFFNVKKFIETLNFGMWMFAAQSAFFGLTLYFLFRPFTSFIDNLDAFVAGYTFLFMAIIMFVFGIYRLYKMGWNFSPEFPLPRVLVGLTDAGLSATNICCFEARMPTHGNYAVLYLVFAGIFWVISYYTSLFSIGALDWEFAGFGLFLFAAYILTGLIVRSWYENRFTLVGWVKWVVSIAFVFGAAALFIYALAELKWKVLEALVFPAGLTVLVLASFVLRSMYPGGGAAVVTSEHVFPVYQYTPSTGASIQLQESWAYMALFVIAIIFILMGISSGAVLTPSFVGWFMYFTGMLILWTSVLAAYYRGTRQFWKCYELIMREDTDAEAKGSDTLRRFRRQAMRTYDINTLLGRDTHDGGSEEAEHGAERSDNAAGETSAFASPRNMSPETSPLLNPAAAPGAAGGDGDAGGGGTLGSRSVEVEVGLGDRYVESLVAKWDWISAVQADRLKLQKRFLVNNLEMLRVVMAPAASSSPLVQYRAAWDVLQNLEDRLGRLFEIQNKVLVTFMLQVMINARTIEQRVRRDTESFVEFARSRMLAAKSTERKPMVALGLARFLKDGLINTSPESASSIMAYLSDNYEQLREAYRVHAKGKSEEALADNLRNIQEEAELESCREQAMRKILADAASRTGDVSSSCGHAQCADSGSQCVLQAIAQIKELDKTEAARKAAELIHQAMEGPDSNVGSGHRVVLHEYRDHQFAAGNSQQLRDLVVDGGYPHDQDPRAEFRLGDEFLLKSYVENVQDDEKDTDVAVVPGEFPRSLRGLRPPFLSPDSPQDSLCRQGHLEDCYLIAAINVLRKERRGERIRELFMMDQRSRALFSDQELIVGNAEQKAVQTLTTEEQSRMNPLAVAQRAFGMYCVRLLDLEENWRIIPVDTALPVECRVPTSHRYNEDGNEDLIRRKAPVTRLGQERKLAFARSWTPLPDNDDDGKRSRFDAPEELWLPLLEKAYAKLHAGSYDNINRGMMEEAFVRLTGQVAECLRIVETGSTRKLDGITLRQWFNRMMRFKDAGFLMGCGVKSRSASPGRKGLYFGHAYSILNLREFNVDGSQQHFIELQDPYADTATYEGDYHYRDERWTTIQRNAFNYSQQQHEEGRFWMLFRDWVDFFKSVYVCHAFDMPARLLMWGASLKPPKSRWYQVKCQFDLVCDDVFLNMKERAKWVQFSVRHEGNRDEPFYVNFGQVAKHGQDNNVPKNMLFYKLRRNIGRVRRYKDIWNSRLEDQFPVSKVHMARTKVTVEGNLKSSTDYMLVCRFSPNLPAGTQERFRLQLSVVAGSSFVITPKWEGCDAVRFVHASGEHMIDGEVVAAMGTEGAPAPGEEEDEKEETKES